MKNKKIEVEFSITGAEEVEAKLHELSEALWSFQATLNRIANEIINVDFGLTVGIVDHEKEANHARTLSRDHRSSYYDSHDLSRDDGSAGGVGWSEVGGEGND